MLLCLYALQCALQNGQSRGSEQNFRDNKLLNLCRLESCKIALKSFLAIALNNKFVSGKSIFLVCRCVPNNFLGDLGLTFLPTKVVA